jgi:transposase
LRGDEPAENAVRTVKSVEQQTALMLAGMRERLIAGRTQLSNAIRGYAAEFGLAAARGLDKIEPLLVRIAQDELADADARFVCNPGPRLPAVAGRTEGDRDEAAGLASRQRLQSASGADSWSRANRCHDTGDEDARSGCVQHGRHSAAWIGLTRISHTV